VRKLFRVMFPEFRPKSVRSFIRALSDPRVKSLRALVKDAANGTIAFDQAFANETIRRLFETERRLAVHRQVTGWLSLPVHFIPVVGTVAQKAIEEGVGRFLESKARRHSPWFYLISSFESPAALFSALIFLRHGEFTTMGESRATRKSDHDEPGGPEVLFGEIGIH
jgi:hypothetical protein